MKIFFQLTEDQVQERANDNLGRSLTEAEMEIVSQGFHDVCEDVIIEFLAQLELWELVDDAMGGLK